MGNRAFGVGEAKGFDRGHEEGSWKGNRKGRKEGGVIGLILGLLIVIPTFLLDLADLQSVINNISRKIHQLRQRNFQSIS